MRDFVQNLLVYVVVALEDTVEVYEEADRPVELREVINDLGNAKARIERFLGTLPEEVIVEEEEIVVEDAVQSPAISEVIATSPALSLFKNREVPSAETEKVTEEIPTEGEASSSNA